MTNSPASLQPPTVTTRLTSLDLIRGWCLIVIAVDHLLRYPSIFDALTGRGLLWVSAAEGFFFISGMLVSLARGRLMHDAGLWTATRRLWSRAGKLYLASVILAFLYIGIGYVLNDLRVAGVKEGLKYYDSTWQLLWNVFTLQYNYGWSDFLNYYAVFLFISPLVLYVLKRGWAWAVVVPVLALWTFKDVMPFPVPFFYLIWQTYFFLGMVIGYHYPSLMAMVARQPHARRRTIGRAVVGVTALTVLLSFVYTFATPILAASGKSLNEPFKWLHLPPPDTMYRYFFDVKENAAFKAMLQNGRSGLLRLPLFVLWFSALMLLVTRFETSITHRVGWLLLPLGRSSLYVYIIQSALAFIVPLLNLPYTFAINTAINIAVIMLCWLAVRQRFLFRLIPR